MDPDTVIQEIRDVEIQGATSVARRGVALLQDMVDDGASRDELERVADRVKQARPTEPFLRNAVDTALDTGEYSGVLEWIDEGSREAQRHGAALIEDWSTVYTHCHSSTVVGAVTQAAADREVSARVTETRPLYQGRQTAEELADAGVAVELYVDAAARLALRGSDVMLIGADAIARDGTVLNKVGSGMIAAAADALDVPVYVVTHSWKFNPDARTGKAISLEHRDAGEVWRDAPDGVDVENYAFERIDPAHITGIASELGVHAPAGFLDRVLDRYPSLR